MSGFAKYTSKDNFRLNERPTYRRGQGADPIKSFVARSYATYSQNADRIRDARFAKSNELNRDYAVRNKREQMLSEAYMTERDPVKLQGLHGRIKAKMSRSDGALTYALPYVYKTKFDDPRANKQTKTRSKSPFVNRMRSEVGGGGRSSNSPMKNRTPAPPSTAPPRKYRTSPFATLLSQESPVFDKAEEYLENANKNRVKARRKLNMRRGPITRFGGK